MTCNPVMIYRSMKTPRWRRQSSSTSVATSLQTSCLRLLFCFCCVGFRLPCDERRLKRDRIDETCLSLASIVFRLSLSLLGGRRPSSAPCPSKRALDPPPQPRHRHQHRRPWRCSSVAQSSSQGTHSPLPFASLMGHQICLLQKH